MRLLRAKCSFKMLQYMACARPVIVSPVGSNAQILAKGDFGYGPAYEQEWLIAVNELRMIEIFEIRLGRVGRRVAVESLDTRVVATN